MVDRDMRRSHLAVCLLFLSTNTFSEEGSDGRVWSERDIPARELSHSLPDMGHSADMHSSPDLRSVPESSARVADAIFGDALDQDQPLDPVVIHSRRLNAIRDDTSMFHAASRADPIETTLDAMIGHRSAWTARGSDVLMLWALSRDLRRPLTGLPWTVRGRIAMTRPVNIPGLSDPHELVLIRPTSEAAAVIVILQSADEYQEGQEVDAVGLWTGPTVLPRTTAGRNVVLDSLIAWALVPVGVLPRALAKYAAAYKARRFTPSPAQITNAIRQGLARHSGLSR